MRARLEAERKRLEGKEFEEYISPQRTEEEEDDYVSPAEYDKGVARVFKVIEEFQEKEGLPGRGLLYGKDGVKTRVYRYDPESEEMREVTKESTKHESDWSFMDSDDLSLEENRLDESDWGTAYVLMRRRKSRASIIGE